MIVFFKKLVGFVRFCWILGVAGGSQRLLADVMGYWWVLRPYALLIQVFLHLQPFEAQQCTTLGHAGGRGDNGPIMVLTGMLSGGNVGHVPAVFCGVPSLFGPFGCKNICVA